MDDFVTVFIVPKDIDLPAIVLMIASLVATAICVAEVILRKKGRKGIIPWPKWTGPPELGIVAGSILLIGSSAIFISSIIQSNKLVSAYEHGQYEVTEGIVEVLHKQPHEGHDKDDIVRIGNQEFEIDYFNGTRGYNLTIAHGGALKEGVYAKVYHRKGTIIRIDIRKTQKDNEFNSQEPIE